MAAAFRESDNSTDATFYCRLSAFDT